MSIQCSFDGSIYLLTKWDATALSLTKGYSKPVQTNKSESVKQYGNLIDNFIISLSYFMSLLNYNKKCELSFGGFYFTFLK